MHPSIAIIDYPGALRSAVFGLAELFGLADAICRRRGLPLRLSTVVVDGTALADTPVVGHAAAVLPPTLTHEALAAIDPALLAWLRAAHARGTLMASACAGAFVLGEAGLLDGRPVTTHWRLADTLAERFPAARVQAEAILVDDGDLLTAGGLMAWVDLGLELVARFAGPAVMRELGQVLVVDTAPREQRFYRRFTPRLDHGDGAIRQAQRHLQADYAGPVSVAALAAEVHLSERSLLRRFVRATGHTPLQYLQRLRIGQACERLETGDTPVEGVARQVGYEDVSAFRRIFVREMGLTPRAFRARFGHASLVTGVERD